MMERWNSENRREGSAVGGSLLLHALLFAWLLPQLAATHAPALDSVETISFEKIQHVSMQRERVPAATRAVVVHTHAPTPARVKKPSASHAKKQAPPSAKSRTAKATQPPGAPSQPPSLAQGNGTPAPESAKLAVAAAAPARTPAPVAQDRRDQHQQVAAATGTTNGGGNGIFLSSDEQAPVLDANASQELKRRFRINLTLVVLVSDDGKTKEIKFSPPASADIEKQIRDLLGSAHWDAAQCGGGIACEGKATITLYQ